MENAEPKTWCQSVRINMWCQARLEAVRSMCGQPCKIRGAQAPLTADDVPLATLMVRCWALTVDVLLFETLTLG
eukprot:scaffold64123_cov23-Tisochrysis_lutea.AAC.1